MNMNDFNSEDLENARINRESRMNPPMQDPGMEDDWGSNFGGDDVLSNSMGPNMGGAGEIGGVGGDPWGSSWGAPSPTPWGNQGAGTQQNTQMSDEDKAWNVCVKGFGLVKNFFTEFFSSFKKWNSARKVTYFWASLIISAICLVLILVAKVAMGYTHALRAFAGVLLGFAASPFLFMSAMEDINRNGLPSDNSSEPPVIDEPPIDMFADVEGEEYPEPEFEDEEEEPTIADEDPFAALGSMHDFEDTTDIGNNMTTILDSIDVDKGMVTRQYLYEHIVCCLKNINRNFDEIREIDEDSNEFAFWDNIVQSCGETFRTGNSEDMPYLISAKEKLFYVSLEVQRVKWIKNIQAYVDEIVNMYSFDTETQKKKQGVYGLGTPVGDRIYIKIMKGESAFVSLKDAYDKVKPEILNTENYLPIIIGIGQEGDVIWRDFKKINSLLVAGMPRSGKSWFIKCLLAQMMFWLKPSELQFILLDPKAEISDFTAIKTPHIKKFVSSDAEIINELRYVVTTEADRRRRIMQEAGGFIDFWDLKRLRPDIEFPMLYIVIDEVVTLAERMDKDTKAEFQALLMQFTSQLPALGLRIFMIPHMVKNDIIKKSVTDLIPCRISVCGDPAHIEGTTGAKGKDFPQKLANPGDMAVKLNNDDVIFTHGAVLSNTNEGVSDTFDFLARFWGKIEPESIENSVMNSGRGTSNNGETVRTPNRVNMHESSSLSAEDYDALLNEVNSDNDYDDVPIDDLFD